MASSCKLAVAENRKATNTFYVWYGELCRRSNSTPLSFVKPTKLKNSTILDFVADRVKPEEWTPILNALRHDRSLHVIAIKSRIPECKFLYDVNTAEKVRRMSRRYGYLWTDFILSSLLKSLGDILKNTHVLSSLELEGLPVSENYLELLFQSLPGNRTLKLLSLKRCPISDWGCRQLCILLRTLTNVEILNLSSCNLSSISGQFIADVIKQQQLDRMCVTWHQSLRYAEPKIENIGGLKRLTLNNNPDMGDEGLCFILEQLDDDYWIKAIDMQNCNITEYMTQRIVNVIEHSSSLEVADFRNNDQLSYATMEKILNVLHRKFRLGIEPEYQWCTTMTNLTEFTATPRTSITGVTAVIQKSRSLPLKQSEYLRNGTRVPLRRTNTFAAIEGKHMCLNGCTQLHKRELLEASRQFSSEINRKLHETIARKRFLGKTAVKLAKNECKGFQRNINNSSTSEFSQLSNIMANMKLDHPRYKPRMTKEDLNVKQKRPSTKGNPYRRSTKNKSTPRKLNTSAVKNPVQPVITSEIQHKRNVAEIFENLMHYKEESVITTGVYKDYYNLDDDFGIIKKQPERINGFTNQSLIDLKWEQTLTVGGNRFSSDVNVDQYIDESLELCLDMEDIPKSRTSSTSKKKTRNYLNKAQLDAG